MKKLIILFVVLAGFGVSSFAQSSDVANSTATLVTPIAISNTTGFNFGTLASSAAAGTISIGYNGALGTPTGGVSAITGAPTTAVFAVTGAANESFAITLNTTGPVVLTRALGGTLSLGSIACQEGASTTLDNTGAKSLYLQGTLSVPAASVAGLYENTGGIEVTVNYN